MIDQIDVETAFPHPAIEEEVYLEQPQEFVQKAPEGGI